MKNHKLIGMIGLLALSLLGFTACGNSSGVGEETPEPTQTLFVQIGVNPIPVITEVPELPQPTQTEAVVKNSCLIGTWEIDHEAFRSYLLNSVNVSDQAQFEFGEIDGSFEMVITEETMTYTSTEPLDIPLKLSAGGIELISMEMQVAGAGGAFWITYEDYFIVYGQDYNFFGEGLADMLNTDLLGQGVVSITITPELFISSATFENAPIEHVLELYPHIENYAVATYTCEGDVFTYKFGKYESVWLRK